MKRYTQNELRKMYMEPSEELKARIHQEVLSLPTREQEEKNVKKKLSAGLIFVIILPLIVVTALAAGVEDINAMLFKLWPEAARALRPLNLSCESAGIRLDLLSATMSDDHLLITYSLTDLEANRISENTKCSSIALNSTMSKISSSDRIISFDGANRQAVFASYYEFTPADYPEGIILGDADKFLFSVKGVMNPAATALDLWPLMENQDYNVESVPGPSAPSAVETISFDGSDVKDKIPKILNPANNLHIPLWKDIELSGIGWIDGMMHVQIHVSNYTARIETERGSSSYARKSCVINLRDRQGNDVMWAPGFFEELRDEMPYFIWGENWRDGDDLWIEKIFPVQPQEMEQYVIHAELTDNMPDNGYEDLLQYEWKVVFPTNMIQLEADE